MPAFAFKPHSIYFLDAARTAVGSPFKSLKNCVAVELGARVIAGLMARQKLDPKKLDEVVLGHTVMAGGGQNPARQAAILAGLAVTTPAYTVNHVCAAGLQSVIQASRAIALGDSSLVIAGGMESATHAPQLFSKLNDAPFSEREPVDSLIFDGLWCPLSRQHMGQLCEGLAKKAKISRAQQDQYAFASHQKAQSASKARKFENEIVEVVLADGSLYEMDERLRHVTLENIQSLPPAFADYGTVTSGNASTPCDGAAAVLMASPAVISKLKRKPLASLLGYASLAVEPKAVFTAAVPAVQMVLKTCGLKLSDIDLFEVCEAFAAQAIYTRDALKISKDKMNVYGGDVALGHPLGAAGARILVTLLHALKDRKQKRGLAVICLGGGGAVSVVVENFAYKG